MFKVGQRVKVIGIKRKNISPVYIPTEYEQYSEFINNTYTIEEVKAFDNYKYKLKDIPSLVWHDEELVAVNRIYLGGE